MQLSTNEEVMDFFSDVTTVEEYSNSGGKFWKAVGSFFALIGMSILIALLFVPGLMMHVSAALPLVEPVVQMWKEMPEYLEDISIGERNNIYDDNGNQIAQVWTEDRVILEDVNDISEYAKQGLIDTEDKRFYEHGGIDLIGTARAAISNSGGGSGITQQLVKNLQFYNLSGTTDKQDATAETYNRKVQELKYAMAYERTHTKDEILLAYFNTVAFGSPTIYSIESAAQYFFGKPASDLTLAESAALVGTVKNPSAYNLDEEVEEGVDPLWKERQGIVLARMFSEGHITKQERDDAYNETLTIVRKQTSSGNCSSAAYAFYCDYVMKNLREDERLAETREERDAILARGGLNIHTHLNAAANDVLNDSIIRDFGTDNRVTAPTAIVEPGTGAVKAFGFNRTYGKGDGKTVINLADVPAGTGSTFKMITLAAAYEAGYTDADLTFSSSCPLRPGAGYDAPSGGFINSVGCSFQAGTLTPEKATAWSSNTWFVTLAMKIGMDKVFNMTERLGLTIPDNISDRSLSFVLGVTENSPIDMAAAFAAFSNQGVYCPPTPVKNYAYDDGSEPVVPETYDPTLTSCRSVMSPHTASEVLQAMRANTYNGYVDGAFGTDANISGYDAVGKSGTNEQYNLVWGQVSNDYSIFTNIYDMDKVTNGITNFWWRGQNAPLNVAGISSSSYLLDVVNATNPERTSLDYNNKDTKHVEVVVDDREFFNMPSFMGMTPENALAAAEQLGIEVHVHKDLVEAPEGYQSGVIVQQSISPGEKLAVGTQQELILYVSE